MAAVTDAPPTVDTISWEEVVNLGAEAWQHSEQAKWDIGDIGAIVCHKWQKDSLKSFANDIGMFDSPKKLYDYVQVSSYWNDKAARAEFAKSSWSAFREVARSKMPLSDAARFMTEHGDKPVAKIKALLKPTASPPKPVRVEYDADILNRVGDTGVVNFLVWGSEEFTSLVKQHGIGTAKITIEYTPAATTPRPDA